MGSYKFIISLDGDKNVSAAVNKLTSDMDKMSASGAKAGVGTKKWLEGATESFKKLNPHLFQSAGEESGKVFGKKFNDGFKQVLWGSKTMQGMQFPATPGWLQNLAGPMKQTKALQSFIDQQFASSGKMVDKDFWTQKFPPLITKGLRDMTGRDLAKVAGMGDITQFDPIKLGVNWRKMMMGGATALFNPWIGSRLMSDAMPPGGGGGKIATGIFGAGGAMGFAEFYLAIQAFRKAVDLFWKVIKSATDNAAKYYSSALNNGMGIAFTVKRQNLAAIMGVDEKEVFRFGAQMAYLAPKIAYANKVLSETTKPLTALSWNFKVLELDFQALLASLVSDLSPALLQVTVGLQKLVTGFDMLANSKLFKAMIMGIAITAGGPAAWAAIASMTSTKDNGMPNAGSWMKQLPASHWEKMGLVTMGSSQNYSRDIAKNTGQTVKLLTRLVMGGGRSSGHGAAGSWDMSQFVAQP